MDVMTEEHQHREMAMRERARRISVICDRLNGCDIWKAAEEIERLERKVMELERNLSEQSGNGK
jgi:polyhydroxyalkanoate synthesis regulator phasin